MIAVCEVLFLGRPGVTCGFSDMKLVEKAKAVGEWGRWREGGSECRGSEGEQNMGLNYSSVTNPVYDSFPLLVR